jgi:hypothetical protein
MYTLISLLPFRRLAYEQVPALAAAWIIAELFYKFHSFSLEAAAFLVTWGAIDAIVQETVRPLLAWWRARHGS